jgi:hypothetical protein
MGKYKTEKVPQNLKKEDQVLKADDKEKHCIFVLFCVELCFR